MRGQGGVQAWWTTGWIACKHGSGRGAFERVRGWDWRAGRHAGRWVAGWWPGGQADRLAGRWVLWLADGWVGERVRWLGAAKRADQPVGGLVGEACTFCFSSHMLTQRLAWFSWLLPLLHGITFYDPEIVDNTPEAVEYRGQCCSAVMIFCFKKKSGRQVVRLSQVVVNTP